MKNLRALWAALILAVTSCSTDVNLNTEWQEFTVIYGLLDQSQEYQYIRINKSFLGSGNALGYTGIRDSSEYDPALVNGRVEEYVNGTLARTWALRDTTLTNKPEGDFYSPNYTVYYFRASQLIDLKYLNQNALYKLVVEIGPDDNKKVVTAQTELVRDFTINAPIANVAGQPQQINVNFYAGPTPTGTYMSPTFKITSSVGAKRFNMKVLFKYDEVRPSETIRRTIDWNLGDATTSVTTGGQTVEKTIDGESFYQIIQNRISNTPELNNPDVTKRVFRGLDFIAIAGAEELVIYTDVNAPVTGIIQERPGYTNIQNGLGLFSARHRKTVDNKWMTGKTLEQLVLGQYTGNFLFCSDSTIHSGEPTFCP